MTVQINLLNGDAITVDDHTPLFAWTSEDNSDGKEFYATGIFGGSRSDNPQIDTSDFRVGLQGLLGTADWFAVGNPNNELYKTSAILSIK
ncbi:hypothetical protein GNF18_10360 [Ligilactobacillus pobuzihii]|uniref:hypothetical protein n=1 Tax=Ligilactobacillus pobuzihii TaxID=449659 RepID=UPI0019D24449|nr:hypothetical protein [Ligilactobacillus pobuzihii]MBN7275543.1 hypothetical protein [Ligilactobacillus pobuzihii]